MTLASALERGAFDGPVGRCIALLWAQVARRSLLRPVVYDGQALIVAVGGATLGGSGKTPLAIACATTLAAAGVRVVFVGHAYRARPRIPRRVSIFDSVQDVGDEALVAAQVLSPAGVDVVVGPRRSAAVSFASRLADVVVMDGVAQTSPVRASLALLAVDGCEPWGKTGLVPPSGDLRAPVDALRTACDAVVAITDPEMESFNKVVGAWTATVRSRGVWINERIVPWSCLRGTRVGLVCALARADRVARFLEARGVTVSALIRERDHGPVRPSLAGRLSRANGRECVDLWMTTAKCAVHLAATQHRHSCVNPAVIDYSLSPEGELLSQLRALASRRRALTGDISGHILKSHLRGIEERGAKGPSFRPERVTE